VHVPQGRRQAGISLVEQIMVIALVAVLAGIAWPSLGHLVRSQRLRGAQFAYVAALRYARAAAVLEDTRMLFCPSADGRHCGDHDDWAHGWLLARDRDRDGHPDGAPLRVGRMAPQLSIRGSTGRDQVRFLPDGSALGSNLSLLFCPPGGHGRALRVVVSNAGRIRGARATPAEAAACKADESP
jgi:type IV fimbrial biogenesis protein FimT